MNFVPYDSILVIGVNSRAIAKSAKKLDFEVFVVDIFDDVDLKENVDFLYALERKADSEKLDRSERELLFDSAHRIIEENDIDVLILGSGMEHDPEKVRELEKKSTILGNDADKLEFCENKTELFQLAKELGIPHPETKKVDSLSEALGTGGEMNYPVLLKPSKSGGGIGIKLVNSPEDLEKNFEEVLSEGDNETLYVQKYIQGKDASASVISNGEKATCLTVNKQIIGDESLDVPRRFGYCGNIVPLSTDETIRKRIEKYSQKICEHIGLVGSNGVDFVISDKPYLLEVNPRFQNTIDLVEGCLDMNLVKSHIKAVNGANIEEKKLKKTGTKLVIYARKDFQTPNLTQYPNTVDIPIEGKTLKQGEPICSVINFGENKEKTIKRAYQQAEKIQSKCYRS